MASQKPNFHVIYIGELESAPPLCYFLQAIMYPKSAPRCSSQQAAVGKGACRSRKGREPKFLIPNCLDTSLPRAFQTWPEKSTIKYTVRKASFLAGRGAGWTAFHSHSCIHASPYLSVTWQQGEHITNPSLQPWHYFSTDQPIVPGWYSSARNKSCGSNIAPWACSSSQKFLLGYILTVFLESGAILYLQQIWFSAAARYQFMKIEGDTECIL